jgi:hypothetical protein
VALVTCGAHRGLTERARPTIALEGDLIGGPADQTVRSLVR